MSPMMNLMHIVEWAHVALAAAVDFAPVENIPHNVEVAAQVALVLLMAKIAWQFLPVCFAFAERTSLYAARFFQVLGAVHKSSSEYMRRGFVRVVLWLIRRK